MTLWQSRTKRMDGSAIETSEGAVQVGQPALKNANAALIVVQCQHTSSLSPQSRASFYTTG